MIKSKGNLDILICYLEKIFEGNKIDIRPEDFDENINSNVRTNFFNY